MLPVKCASSDSYVPPPMGALGDTFEDRVKLEGDVQLRTTSRESLQPKTCWAALLPKVYYMGELVLGEGMGRELEGPW